VHHTKSMLELVQDAMAVMGKLESLTSELPDLSITNGPVEPTSTAAQVERIASEVSRLAFYMTEGSSIPIIQGLGPRVSSVTSKLRTVIMATLKTTLARSSQANDAAASSCIHASSLIMDMDAAHTAVQECLIEPAVARAVSSSATSAPNEVVRFPVFLESAQAELEHQIARVNGMLAHHPDLASTFDLLGTCVLGAVHDAIKAQLPGSFSPAVPDAFHRNYTAAMAFVSWLEDCASTEGALKLLHNSVPRTTFNKAWNLAVYFSLQFQDIARSFDSHLHSAPTPVSPGGPWSFAQTQAVIDALQRCRDKSVTFPAVYDRFFKLQMQIILRYGCWLREAQDHRATAGNAGGTRPAGGQSTLDATTAGGQSTSGPGAGDSAPLIHQWAKTATSENVVVVLADACKLVQRLLGPETDAILDQLRPVTSQAALERAQQVRSSLLSFIQTHI
jgi:conserved oligomeric Golgi complex subunit 2